MKKLPKFKTYNGQALSGKVDIYTKLDGVAVFINRQGNAFSKNNKKLYNIPPMPAGWYEAFTHSWNKTISIVKKRDGSNGSILPAQMYPIYPRCDQRLYIGTLENPPEEWINKILKHQLDLGHEGLIMWRRNPIHRHPFKVKDKFTVDVRVIDQIEGVGRNEGRLGAFKTVYGNVGTGLTDSQREEYWANPLTNEIIEVEIMQWTADMKMRNPRFVRPRLDKSVENLERNDR